MRETRAKKVIKVTLDEDGGIWFTVEMIVAGQHRVPDAEHLAQVLPRAISQLADAVAAVLTAIQLEQMVAG